jgi:rhodanese-related sulfurtransferase
MKLPIVLGLSATVLLAALSLRPTAADAEHGAKTTAPDAGSKAAGFKNVGVQEFDKLRHDKKAVVLDVRTPTEYKAGHIPGATNINVNSPDFEEKVRSLDTNRTYLVHCGAGVRSAKACDKLSKLQFRQLYNLEGGMTAWQKAGNKAEK